MAGEKIASMIKKAEKTAGPDSFDLLFGEVVNVNPLKIKFASGVEVGDDFLILSSMCRPLTVNVKINAHTHKISQQTTEENINIGHQHLIGPFSTETNDTMNLQINLWSDLIVGDQVRVFKAQGNEIYYVIERGGRF